MRRPSSAFLCWTPLISVHEESPKLGGLRAPVCIFGVGSSVLREEIYLLETDRGDVSRESVVLGNLVEALKQRCRSKDAILRHEKFVSHSAAFSLPAEFSGAFRYKAEAKVMTAGQEAFVALADYYKSAVLVDAVDLLPSIDTVRRPIREDTIKQVVWSSINTRKLISLGPSSWKTIQLLPGGSRHNFRCPPIRLRPHETRSAEADYQVLVIAHCDLEDASAEAVRIAKKLAKPLSGRVRTLGFEVDGLRQMRPDEFGETGADVHVHVGRHNSETSQLRIVDSWISGCTVIHRLLNSDVALHADDYRIDDGANGLNASTLDEVVSGVLALLHDPYLRRTLNRAGRLMVANATADWEQIVDILAD